MCHIIFDVSMDFSSKAWMVANGLMTESSSSITYSSVISRYSVSLDLLIDGLNDLNIMVCDFGYFYFNVSCIEKL